MNGNCLAGDSCQFSHDPALLINHLNVNDNTASQQNFQLQDQYDQFPALSTQAARGTTQQLSATANNFLPAAGTLAVHRPRSGPGGLGPGSRPQSRPNSRHQNRPETPSSLAMDDPDAFPSLGSLSAKRGSKHHGHRSRHGHGSGERETPPSSLADVVRMSPSPAPGQRKLESGRKIRTYGGSESTAAKKIPEPQHIPWLETGERANQQYLKYRAEAIKHGSIRNKFLQR